MPCNPRRVTGAFVVAIVGVAGGVGCDAADRRAALGEEAPLAEKARPVDVGKAVSPVAASSRASVRDKVIAAAGRWSVSHATNADGSFSLVRNASPPGAAAEPVHASLGDGDEQVLEARETRVWDCDSIPENAQLKVTAGSGAVIYEAPIECGDAVYVRPAAPE